MLSALEIERLALMIEHTCLILPEDVFTMSELMKKCTGSSCKFHVIQGLAIQSGHIISVLGKLVRCISSSECTRTDSYLVLQCDIVLESPSVGTFTLMA